MCTDLKFALLNIQGLATKCTNKLECEEVKNLFSNNDIVMFTEHWVAVLKFYGEWFYFL